MNNRTPEEIGPCSVCERIPPCDCEITDDLWAAAMTFLDEMSDGG